MVELSRAQTVGRALSDAAKELPDKPCYIHEEREISFREVDEMSDRVAS